MDKNKNRTDLLAAGRKKLQQFRQKKDNKGGSSQGKSLKKSVKSDQHESDADASSNTSKSKGSLQVHEEEIISHADSTLEGVNSSESDLVENSVPYDVDVAVVNPSSNPVKPEESMAETAISHDTETGSQSMEINKNDIISSDLNGGEGTQGVVPLNLSDIPDSERESKHDDTFVRVDMPTSHAVSDVERTADTVVEDINSEEAEVKESLSSLEDTPDIPLVYIRGDQEADGLGLEQSDRSHDIELEGDRRLSISQHGDIADAVEGSSSEQTGLEEVACAMKQADGVNAVSGSSTDRPDMSLASYMAVSDVDRNLGDHEVTHQWGEVVDVGPSNAYNTDMVSESGHYGKEEGDQDDRSVADVSNEQYMPEDSFIFVGKSHERPLSTDSTNSPGGSHLGDVSISLPQLIEVIRGLGEDEYASLLRSRALVSNTNLGTSDINLLQPGLPGLWERLKEELFLTNCTKNLLHMQLAEQSDLQIEYDHQFCQFKDEISMLCASLKQALERDDYLNKELIECRSELEISVSERANLQSQFLAAKAEAEEISARAHELQSSLDQSHSDLLILSKESANSKDLVSSLKLENEILASMTEDRKKLIEERDSCLHENEKLLEEIGSCKNLVAALQVESSNFSESLALLAEERKKLEEEKEYHVGANEKLLTELSDCKGLVEALQVENANLSGNLSLMTKEQEKLEEFKKYFVSENERLLSELPVLHEKLSQEHEECMRLEAELKEVTVHLEKLTEENMLLNRFMEMHKANYGETGGKQAQDLSVVGEDLHQGGSLEQKKSCENVTDGQAQQISGKQDSEAGFLSPELSEQEVINHPYGLIALNRRLGETGKILLKLENAVEGMHSHSVSLSRSVSKVAAPAVSKLIQAFESKAHTDEPELEEKGLTEVDQSPVVDSFTASKEHMGKLKAVIKHLELDAENASLAFKVEQDCKSVADLTIRKLEDQLVAVEEHADSLEAINIELEVLHEVAKQHLSGVIQKNNELELLCEHLKQQNMGLKADKSELDEKLKHSDSRIKELQSQLHDLQRSSDEVASILHDELVNFQNEAAEKALSFEQEQNSSISQVIEAITRLDDCTETSFTSINLSGTSGLFHISSHVSASVDAAVKMMANLKEKLDATQTNHEATSNLLSEMNEQCNELLGKNELAKDALLKLYHALSKLVIDSCGAQEESEVMIQDDNLLDPVDYNRYRVLIEKLENFLSERLRLQSLNNELNVELMIRSKDIEELNLRCLDLSCIQKLIENIENVLKPEDAQMDMDKTSTSRLESLVSFLVLKYTEADKLVSSSREEFGSKEIELAKLQDKIHQLTDLQLQHENEILFLKEKLSQAEETLVALRSEFQEKAHELEQSEQRVSSIREKLSIAVAKGKGLVVQRDTLKQSLVETSSELERCSQELQLKDARLLELETKLKTYSEAGERVEALESELSYIRNSATALRESFLLKDSVLQRIEEILEDLDLPEHFHSGGIIEKVDWLARSVTGNSLPPTDWEQKSSMGGSYSDSGFVVMDAWKEDAPSSNSGDDLRRKYEELQNKFYGLAEQNEMLEESLMKRNYLVQRWEELLDQINMPSQVRSLEPEDRIQWLGNTLSEADQDKHSLLQKIDKLENYCGSLTADLENCQEKILSQIAELESSQKKISDLEMNLQTAIQERDTISERLNIVTIDREKLSAEVVQFELDKEKWHSELADLREKLVEKLGNDERLQIIDGEISRLKDLICDALQDVQTKALVSGSNGIECLESLVRKLIENCTNDPSVNPGLGYAVEEHSPETAVANIIEGRTRETLDNVESDIVLMSRDTEGSGEPNVEILRREMEGTLTELMHVKEERDSYMEKHQSLTAEIEALNKERVELLELLKQEEQKSTSVREKLNVAVRKGKSLVQQRDGLKQTIEEMNSELERLKYEIKQREDGLTDYEQKIRDLTTYPERVEALESESALLRNHMAEMDRFWQEKGHTLTSILNTLGEIDVGGEIDNSNPIEKLEYIAKQWSDLHTVVSSSEQDSKKSRRAAELLLAELNEVQDRNDSLQEDLAKLKFELAELYKERDMADAAKRDALSDLEKQTMVHSEEKKKTHSELLLLKSDVDQLWKSFSDVNNLIDGVFGKDLEFLQNLGTGLQCCLKRKSSNLLVQVPLLSVPDGITSDNSENKVNLLSLGFSTETFKPEDSEDNFIYGVCGSVQDIVKQIGALLVKVREHSVRSHEQASNLAKLVDVLNLEMSSQKEAFEAMRKDINDLESIRKEKEMEAVVLHRNISMLYEACTSLLVEIENSKANVAGNTFPDGGPPFNLKPATFSDGGLNFGGENNLLSEEHIRSITEKLLLDVKNFVSLKDEFAEGDKREMKITISNLQKELHEKDIQRERISMELVAQIKEAEASMSRYSLDLQSSETRVHDLEQQAEMMVEERNSLEQRIKELQDRQAMLTELEDKVKLLTDTLASKDQEIEALMQALDEEEVQMEDLTHKIEEMEKAVQEKNLDLENLEASRGKVLKKLSTTVSKFDELHHFSESLLTEVEKLQAQLQDRDTEISFLRQEVTRCTNDVLVASQLCNKGNSEAMHELLAWLDTVVSPVGMQDVNLDDISQVHEYKETFQKRITSILSELEELRRETQSREALLQTERSRVEELKCREEALEKSLLEKESLLSVHGAVGELGQRTSSVPEILEVEPVINKWVAPVPSSTSKVRSLRKANNDQVAIAIDMDHADSHRLEDEDDDKVHGFKSLTTSRIVPKFTRPVTDMIDGLWVSCDRTLMRQPAFRLGIMMYWAVLHALLVAFAF